MIQNLGIKEVVSIRGLSLQIEDIEFERDVVDTVMWNPLHFAVYYQNIDLVKYILKTLKVNLGMTAPKANAESERDVINNDKYPEDKIMLLLLAYDRKNSTILRYLLDEGFRFWPQKTIVNLIEERINEDIMNYNDALQ